MPDLVKRVYEYEQRERLSTDALGAQAMVMSGNNFMKMQDCKILDDSVLETVVAGEKKEVAILFDPIQLTINMRKYWTPGGIIWKIRYFFVWLAMRSMFMMDLGILRFNVYFLNATGEYTIDPSKDWTPWELQRKLEAFLQLQGKLLKANIKEKMISGASEQQNLMNAMKWFIILIAVIVIGFLIVMNGGA